MINDNINKMFNPKIISQLMALMQLKKCGFNHFKACIIIQFKDLTA